MTAVPHDSNTSPPEPCAACKHQRRQCSSDCQLAPYFPADKQREFANAHRLFGYCNIMKILRKVGPSQQAEAMRSIIFESDMWAQFPNGGCHHLILELNRIHQHIAGELALTKHHLQHHRSLKQQQQQQQEKEKEDTNTVDDVKRMVESGAGTAERRMYYFVASLSLRVLLLLCSVTGLALLLTGGNGSARFPSAFVSLLDAGVGRSPVLVCFLVVVLVVCLYSIVTMLASFSVIYIPYLPPWLSRLLALCNNPQLLRELKIPGKHQDSALEDDLEEGLKKNEWLGEDENKEEARENGKI